MNRSRSSLRPQLTVERLEDRQLLSTAGDLLPLHDAVRQTLLDTAAQAHFLTPENGQGIVRDDPGDVIEVPDSQMPAIDWNTPFTVIARAQVLDDPANYPESAVTLIEKGTFDQNGASWGMALRPGAGVVDVWMQGAQGNSHRIYRRFALTGIDLTAEHTYAMTNGASGGAGEVRVFVDGIELQDLRHQEDALGERSIRSPAPAQTADGFGGPHAFIPCQIRGVMVMPGKVTPEALKDIAEARVQAPAAVPAIQEATAPVASPVTASTPSAETALPSAEDLRREEIRRRVGEIETELEGMDRAEQGNPLPDATVLLGGGGLVRRTMADRVTVPHGADIDFETTAPFSFVVRAQVTEDPAAYRSDSILTLFEKGRLADDRQSYGMALRPGAGVIDLWLQGPGGSVRRIFRRFAMSGADMRQEHTYTFSYSGHPGDGIQLYVDGAALPLRYSEDGIGGDSIRSGEPLEIGEGMKGEVEQAIPGNILEVSVLKRALNAGDAQGLEAWRTQWMTAQTGRAERKTALEKELAMLANEERDLPFVDGLRRQMIATVEQMAKEHAALLSALAHLAELDRSVTDPQKRQAMGLDGSLTRLLADAHLVEALTTVPDREIRGPFRYGIDRAGDGMVFTYENGMPGWVLEVWNEGSSSPLATYPLSAEGGKLNVSGLGSIFLTARDTMTGLGMGLDQGTAKFGDGAKPWTTMAGVPRTVDEGTIVHDELLRFVLERLPAPSPSAFPSDGARDRFRAELMEVCGTSIKASRLSLAHRIAPDLFGGTEEDDHRVYDAKIATMGNWGGNARPMLDGMRRDAMAEVDRQMKEAYGQMEKALSDRFFEAYEWISGRQSPGFRAMLEGERRGILNTPEVYGDVDKTAIRGIFGQMMGIYSRILRDYSVVQPANPAQVNEEARKRIIDLLFSYDPEMASFKERHMGELMAIANGEADGRAMVARLEESGRVAEASSSESFLERYPEAVAWAGQEMLHGNGIPANVHLGELQQGTFPAQGLSFERGMSYTYGFEVRNDPVMLQGIKVTIGGQASFPASVVIRDTSGTIVHMATGEVGKPVIIDQFLTPGHYRLSVVKHSTNGAAIAKEGLSFSIQGELKKGPFSFVAGQVERDGKRFPVKMMGFGGLDHQNQIIKKEILPSVPTWVVIHGMNSSPSANGIKELLASLSQLANKYHYQVVAVDWQEAAKSLLNLGSDARWTDEVGKWLGQQLQRLEISAVDTYFASHSHGTFVTHDASKFLLETTGQKVGAIVALDPAGNFSPISGRSTAKMAFKDLAERSWAIEGSFVAGSNRLASTADIAIQISSPLTSRISTEHGLPVTVFSNILGHEANNEVCSTEISRHLSMEKMLGRDGIVQYKLDAYKGKYEAILTVGIETVEENGQKWHKAIPLMLNYYKDGTDEEQIEIQVCNTNR
ncbi:MAG: hypothetical protein Greene041619_907 [Candidatus Peregrinibacteria bacterium Greene0416_19]|nr:MAG: hypothetical protein Greene041619_907 [Candidatus Peregrinibacteria bacterium Greene0416_19]